ncbi:MAG: hypothetical protein DLM60_19790, partial [Pseudonocardiales bacterium]
KLAAVVRGQAGAALPASHDAEQRPFAQAVAGWQVANIAARLRPDLSDSSTGEPMDGARLLFGYRAPDGAFVAEPGPGAGELFVDPAATSGLPGMRVPHVALHRNGIPVSPGVFDALGLQAVVHKVGPDGLLDPGGAWATASGLGPTGTVLVRPDGVVAWRTPGPAGAGELDKTLRTVLAR